MASSKKKVVLRGINYSVHRGDEKGPAYSARVYVDERHVADASYDGGGGKDEVIPTEHASPKDIALLMEAGEPTLHAQVRAHIERRNAQSRRCRGDGRGDGSGASV